MSLHIESVRYGSSREHLAYVARPERLALPAPAVLVFQEAWGVDAHIEDVTRRFALAGYVAVAPDMFARDGARPAPLSKERLAETLAFVNEQPMGVAFDPSRRKEALAPRGEAFATRIEESIGAIMAGLDLGKYVPHLVATSRFLREEYAPTRGQPLVSVGFCMGGALSALLACHDPDLRGAVIFYGSPPPDDQIANIRCPVLDFLGSKDARLMASLPAFQEKMRAAGKKLDVHVYEGAEHAFFNDARPAYDGRATRDSFARTLSFFTSVLA
jgi:carboxymethylenebutenolidase